MPENTERPKVNSKQMERFVYAYLETWNATKAAHIAGYKSPEKQGSRILQRDDVQALITYEMGKVAMPANEVLARIAQEARANPGDFFLYKEVEEKDENDAPIVDPKTGEIKRRLISDGLNWEMVRTHGYLIREISWTKAGRPVIKMVDTQKAKELIGKHHRLFVDQVDMNVNAAVKGYVGISPDDWDEDSGE